MGKVIELFKDRELTLEQRASVIQRITDLALKITDLQVELALYESEKERLETRLNQ